MHRNTEVGVFPVTGHKQCLHCKAAARAPLGPRPRRGYVAEETSIFCFPRSPQETRALNPRSSVYITQTRKKDIRLFVRRSTSPLGGAADCTTLSLRPPPPPIDYNDVVKGFKRDDNCFVVVLFISSS